MIWKTLNSNSFQPHGHVGVSFVHAGHAVFVQLITFLVSIDINTGHYQTNENEDSAPFGTSVQYRRCMLHTLVFVSMFLANIVIQVVNGR